MSTYKMHNSYFVIWGNSVNFDILSRSFCHAHDADYAVQVADMHADDWEDDGPPSEPDDDEPDDTSSSLSSVDESALIIATSRSEAATPPCSAARFLSRILRNIYVLAHRFIQSLAFA